MDIAGVNWPSNFPQFLWTRQCPLCGSNEFQAAELHSLDGLLRLFGLRPVRCVNCWRRYYWFMKRSSDKA